MIGNGTNHLGANLSYKNAMARASGRHQHTVIVIPMRKTEEWWQKTALERHAYFYPHSDPESGTQAKGHALSAEAGISRIFRRLYYNPDGNSRPGEFDFITTSLLRVCGRAPSALRGNLQAAAGRHDESGVAGRCRRA